MENRLKELFEYQKFEQNPKLDKLIRETELRYPEKLSEDELEMVSAAGTPGFEQSSEKDPNMPKPLI